MFEEAIRALQKLEQAELQIYASGEYPTKQRTKVQAVAHYQNDGTDRGVKPARFVEKAASKNRNWVNPWGQSVLKYIGGDQSAIMDLGLRISYDINTAVNRIKTGRLKKSMLPRIKGNV
jgi:hypothetical protein